MSSLSAAELVAEVEEGRRNRARLEAEALGLRRELDFQASEASQASQAKERLEERHAGEVAALKRAWAEAAAKAEKGLAALRSEHERYAAAQDEVT